jgi:23S rRNA pseudouridine1911/1915/1917 synthase
LKIQREIHLKVPPGQKKLRIDKYLSLHIENSSRTKIQKAIVEGCVQVNSRVIKSNYIVQPEDVIDILLPLLQEKPEVLPENILLDIVYEDKNILVVNKPSGMVTHPAYKNYSGTLVNALMFYLGNKKEGLSALRGLERAGIVHRLDKDTSGVLVIAKDDESHRRLSRLFMKHSIEREYHAVVWGCFHKKNGIIEKSLGRSSKDRKKVIVRDDGKMAVTEYEVISEHGFLSYIRLRLHTGRTHQIRVHMHSVGHPVFGDPDYEGRKPHGVKLTSANKIIIQELLDLIPRQALHAKILGFIHPMTNEIMKFESSLPEDFQRLLLRLNRLQ